MNKLSRKLLLLPLLLLITTACASNPRPKVSPGQLEERPLEPATIEVYPLNSLAGVHGAIVWIDYTIARHPDNRRYLLRWGDELGPIGGTGKNLDGENEPYAFPRIYTSPLSAGQYSAELVVYRIENGKEKIYKAVQGFTIH